MTKQLTFFLLLFISAAAFAQPTIRWQKNYGGSNNDIANSIQQTGDGGFIVAGASYSATGDVTINRGKADFWVAKLDASGTIIWQKTYGGSGWDVAKCVKPTSDGGYIVVGYTNSYDGDVTGRVREPGNTFNYYDGWVLKLNSTGAITWRECLFAITTPVTFGAGNASANTVIQASDGNFVVGGMRQMTGYDAGDNTLAEAYSWAVKLRPSGAVMWQSKQFMFGSFSPTSFADSTGVNSIAEVSGTYTLLSSGYHNTLTGTVSCSATPVANIVTNINLYNINAGTGYTIWYKYNFYDAPGIYDQKMAAYDIKSTSDGGYIIAGSSKPTVGCVTSTGHNGGIDYFVCKTNSTGTIMWKKYFGGSNTDVAKSVFQSADGNFYVGGFSYSSDGQVTDHHAAALVTADYWIVKLNSVGSLLWSKSYGGNGNDMAMAMAKTTNGKYTIAGNSTSSYFSIVNKGGTDWLLINFDDCNILPPTAPSPQNFVICSSPALSSLIAYGTNLKWYSSSSGSTPLPLTTLLPNGNSIYWVSQTSITGCESTRTPVTAQVSSSCRMARINPASQNEILTSDALVYPNPNHGSFQINMPVNIRLSRITVQLVDVYGKIMLSKNCTVTNGYIREAIHAENLAPDIYFIKYTAAEKINTVKLVINR